MGVTYVYADISGKDNLCSTWLCLYPAQGLAKSGYPVKLMSVLEFVKRRPLDEIIVVERLLWNGCDPEIFRDMPDSNLKSALVGFAGLQVLDTVEYVQSKGARVIALFDDHYMAYPMHPEFKTVANMWLNGTIDGVSMGFAPLDDFRRGLGMVDAMMTPSVFLRDHYSKWAKKAYYIHNRPNLELWTVVNNAPRRGDKVNVGWSGTVQHYHTWLDNRPLLDALAAIRDRIRLVGIIPKIIVDIIESYGIEVQPLPPVPIAEFPGIVAGYDIGICPLHGEYDNGRSWIKWLECSLMGKPVVASPLAGAYVECHGGYVLEEESAAAWESALSELIDDPGTYRREAAEGRSWAWAEGWDEHLGELTDVFLEVLDGHRR